MIVSNKSSSIPDTSEVTTRAGNRLLRATSCRRGIDELRASGLFLTYRSARKEPLIKLACHCSLILSSVPRCRCRGKSGAQLPQTNTFACDQRRRTPSRGSDCSRRQSNHVLDILLVYRSHMFLTKMVHSFVDAGGELIFGGQCVCPDILSARLFGFSVFCPMPYEMHQLCRGLVESEPLLQHHRAQDRRGKGQLLPSNMSIAG